MSIFMCDRHGLGRRFSLMIIAGFLGALASCTAPSVGGVGTESGEFEKNLAKDVADYLIVDLATGDTETRATVSDLATNVNYRDRYVVFCAVDSTTTLVGQAESFAKQSDEDQAAVSLTRYFISAFELTQAQWLRISGQTPWTRVPSSIVPSVSGEEHPPAYGISHNVATSTLSAFSVGKTFTLSLPSNNQWEAACRGGNQGLYCWGSDRSSSTIAAYAVVSETTGDEVGPRSVGERLANVYGLYDVHGNVWELTVDGDLRGGSWADSVAQARCANKQQVDTDTPHHLVGVRPVLTLK